MKLTVVLFYMGLTLYTCDDIRQSRCSVIAVLTLSNRYHLHNTHVRYTYFNWDFSDMIIALIHIESF